MSNGDKRSVSTDALETLGKIIDDRAGRDAIHLAVEPIEAGERLTPGQHVGIKKGIAVSGTRIKPLGIVDPFLTSPVEAGQKFWLVVYPRQISSLRHVWTHPDFPEAEHPLVPKEGDVQILKDGAEAIGIGFPEFIEAVNDYVIGGVPEGIFFGKDINYNELPHGFWDAYERYTGRTVPENMREVYFRCAC